MSRIFPYLLWIGRPSYTANGNVSELRPLRYRQLARHSYDEMGPYLPTCHVTESVYPHGHIWR